MPFIIYTTCADAAEAQRIADVLVTEGLAACTHQLGEIKSTYIWEGKLCHSIEVTLVIKTTANKYDAVEARIRNLHSYEVPAILGWTAEKCDPAYAAWLEKAVT